MSSKSWALSASPSSLKSGQESFILSGVLPSVRNVKWGDVGTGAYTTGDTIHLPSPFLGMTETDLILWRYKCQHEIGHEAEENNKPHWSVVMKREKPVRPFRLLWTLCNILSDYSQEKNSLGITYGRDGVLLEGRATWNLCENKPVEQKDDTSVSGMLCGLALHDMIKRHGWNHYMDGRTAQSLILPAWHSAVNAVGDWDSVRNEEDAFQLACELYKLFKDNAPKEVGNAEKRDKAEAAGAEGDASDKKAGVGKDGKDAVDVAIKERVVSPHWTGPSGTEGTPTPNVVKTYTSTGAVKVVPARSAITVRAPVLNGRLTRGGG